MSSAGHCGWGKAVGGAREATLHLETLGREGDLSVAGDAYAALEKEIERLRGVLAVLAEEAMAP